MQEEVIADKFKLSFNTVINWLKKKKREKILLDSCLRCQETVLVLAEVKQGRDKARSLNMSRKCIIHNMS